MVTVIMGLKGSGKTKRLIDLVNEAAKNESGNVVCIERGLEMTYNILPAVRLVDAAEYGMSNLTFLQGFISGLTAGNYDITQIFVDGLNRLVPTASMEELEGLLNWMDAYGEKNSVKFTITMTGDENTAPEGIKKFF